MRQVIVSFFAPSGKVVEEIGPKSKPHGGLAVAWLSPGLASAHDSIMMANGLDVKGMEMVITLGPKLEEALNEVAHQQGIAPEELAVSALQERFLTERPGRDSGMGAEWDRKNARRIELAVRRSRGPLTPDEEVEFRELQNEILEPFEANASRRLMEDDRLEKLEAKYNIPQTL